MTGLCRPRAGRRKQQRNQSGTAVIGLFDYLRLIRRGDRDRLHYPPSFFIRIKTNEKTACAGSRQYHHDG